MRYLFMLLFLSGCTTTETVYVEKVKYVDIETYKTWGTTNLVPIGTRPIPTQEEINCSPLWQYGEPDRAYDERQREEIRKHPGH